MEQLIDTPEQQRVKRGALLSTLCILLWLGCLVVIGVNLLIYASVSRGVGIYNEGYYPEEGVRLKTIMAGAVVYVVMALLSLIGGIGLWKLRRWGFNLYVGAQLLSLGMLVYLYIDSGVRFLRLGSLEQLIVCLAFGLPVAFIVLFGLQLKRFNS